MKHSDREVETLATFVHGSLCALHTLGLVYNLYRKNWGDSAMHAIAMLYDLRSTYNHARQV